MKNELFIVILLSLSCSINCSTTFDFEFDSQPYMDNLFLPFKEYVGEFEAANFDLDQAFEMATYFTEQELESLFSISKLHVDDCIFCGEDDLTASFKRKFKNLSFFNIIKHSQLYYTENTEI